jgi:hypothetical protein
LWGDSDNFMNRLTKSILIIGIILLIYGYLSRVFNLYFFWDAKTIGGILILIALLFYWIGLRRKRKQKGKKNTWVTVGICILALGLALFPVIIVIFHQTEAYHAATEYLKSNPRIKEQIGDVKSFGLFPSGTVKSTTINGEESGNAIFNMTVNGSKKNKDVTIELKKEPETSWTVTRFE